MASKPIYEISHPVLDTGFAVVNYSDTDIYHTLKKEGSDVIFDGSINGYMIRTGGSPYILPSEYYEWKDAVMKYLSDHDEAAENGNLDYNVSFVVTYIDSRACISYERYIDGKLLATGKGWINQMATEKEKQALREAVVKYKKEHGIQTSTEKLDEKRAEMMDAVGHMDDEALPVDVTPEVPLVEMAIPELVTDPCKFIPDLMRYAELAITRINGIPSVKELFEFNFKKARTGMKNLASNTMNSQGSIVTSAITPVSDKIGDMSDYFAQLDAEEEEYRKLHSEDYALFMYSEVEEVDFHEMFRVPPADEDQEGGYSGEPGVSLGDISYDGDISFNDVNYKEVTLDLMAKGGHCRDSYPNTNIPEWAINNMKNALKFCFVPLRKAWETKCKEMGWNPYWYISSGFRPVGVRGQKDNGSAHTKGWAIDVHPYGQLHGGEPTSATLAQFCYEYCKANKNIKIDQIIWEYNGGSKWCHLGYIRPANNGQRGQYCCLNQVQGGIYNVQYT